MPTTSYQSWWNCFLLPSSCIRLCQLRNIERESMRRYVLSLIQHFSIVLDNLMTSVLFSRLTSITLRLWSWRGLIVSSNFLLGHRRLSLYAISQVAGRPGFGSWRASGCPVRTSSRSRWRRRIPSLNFCPWPPFVAVGTMSATPPWATISQTAWDTHPIFLQSQLLLEILGAHSNTHHITHSLSLLAITLQVFFQGTPYHGRGGWVLVKLAPAPASHHYDSDRSRGESNKDNWKDYGYR